MHSIFLFTDIESSTRSWEIDREGMSEFLRLHDEVMKQAIGSYGGSIVKHTGDGVFAVFSDPCDAVRCAVEIQRALRETGIEVDGRMLRVRMGLHCGPSEERGGDHFGPAVNLAQRIMDAANGGQVLLSGQLADTLSEFHEPFGIKDLGVQRLRDLGEPRRLCLLKHPSLADGVGISLRTLSSVPNNLQRPLTPFVGRERELHEIRGLLRDGKARLVTLHGHGGTGKTRLALQATALEAYSFPGGVYFVQLDKIHSTDLVGSAIAEALGLDISSAETGEAVMSYLRRKNVLLVLDNYEHLGPDTSFLRRILSETENTCVLVTSRSRLHLTSEHVYKVKGLGLPNDKEEVGKISDSEKLYFETARRQTGGESVQDSGSVRSICRKLHGNPLAILLAASWHGLLSPAEVLEELETSLSVSSGMSDLPERHRSLRGVFLFSWNTLEEREKSALSSLAVVFQGPFTRKAAGRVCNLDLSALAGLCGKSLLERTESGTFEIHPLVREFAREKAGDVLSKDVLQNLQRKHCEYYLGLLAEGRDAVTLKDSMDDVLLAWSTAVESCQRDMLLSSHRGFRDLLGLRGMYRDGQRVFRETLESCDEDDEDVQEFRAWMLLSLGYFSSFCSPGAVSVQQLGEAVGIFRRTGPEEGLGDSLNMLGNVFYVSGDYQGAYDDYKESLEIRRRLGDRSGVAAVLNNLGNLCCQRMDYSDAEDFYRESIGIERASGNGHGVSSTLANLAIVKMSLNELDEAEELLAEALDLEIEIGDDFNIAIVKGIISSLHLRTGDLDAAEKICSENIETYEGLGNFWGMADCYCKLGQLFTMRGDAGRAAGSLVMAIDAIAGRDWNPLALEILGWSAELLASCEKGFHASSLAEFVRDHDSCSMELSIRMERLLSGTAGTAINREQEETDREIGEFLAEARKILVSLRI